jgi:hypothetical protein
MTKPKELLHIRLDELQDSFKWELLSSDGSSISMSKGISLDKMSWANFVLMKIYFKDVLFSFVELKENYIPVFYFTCVCNNIEGKIEVIFHYGYKVNSEESLNHIFLSSMVN